MRVGDRVVLEIADPVAFSKETADPRKLGSQYPQMVKDIEAAKDPKVTGAENWKAALLRRTEELKFDKDPDPRVGRFLAMANRLREAFVAGRGPGIARTLVALTPLCMLSTPSSGMPLSKAVMAIQYLKPSFTLSISTL